MNTWTSIVTATVLVAGALTLAATPASAAGAGPSVCVDERPGQFVSFVAQVFGHSAETNPGNAQNDAPPFVPSVIGCNPS